MGYQPQLFPVSVKGVVIRDRRVLLLRNERDEWELPGGKLELGEDPASCMAREITEEVGWAVTTGPILDAWQYHIRTGVDVLVVAYGCHTTADTPPAVSSEHREVGLFGGIATVVGGPIAGGIVGGFVGGFVGDALYQQSTTGHVDWGEAGRIRYRRRNSRRLGGMVRRSRSGGGSMIGPPAMGDPFRAVTGRWKRL